MRTFNPSVLLAAAAVTGMMALATPAWADSTISINPGNVPATAADAEHECSANLGAGPFADKDVWVFNLPSNGGAAGDFVSVTATFDTPGGAVTMAIPTDGGAIVSLGTSKAYIAVDAGWTLTGATAVITGTATQFVLTHTCPATGGGNPPPSAMPSGQPSSPPDGSSSPPGSTGASPSGSQSPELPTTGAAITGMVLSGIVAVLVGSALVLMMRRRRAEMTTPQD